MESIEELLADDRLRRRVGVRAELKGGALLGLSAAGMCYGVARLCGYGGEALLQATAVSWGTGFFVGVLIAQHAYEWSLKQYIWQRIQEDFYE